MKEGIVRCATQATEYTVTRGRLWLMIIYLGTSKRRRRGIINPAITIGSSDSRRLSAPPLQPCRLELHLTAFKCRFADNLCTVAESKQNLSSKLHKQQRDDSTNMFCIECGHPLPTLRSDSTICSKCKTPLATWWDESSQSFRTNRESILPSPYHISSGESINISGGEGVDINGVGGEQGSNMSIRRNVQSIEERHFQGALVCLEGHFEKLPGFGDKTMAECRAMVKSALEASLNKADVRFVSHPLLLCYEIQSFQNWRRPNAICSAQRKPRPKCRHLDAP